MKLVGCAGTASLDRTSSAPDLGHFWALRQPLSFPFVSPSHLGTEGGRKYKPRVVHPSCEDGGEGADAKGLIDKILATMEKRHAGVVRLLWWTATSVICQLEWRLKIAGQQHRSLPPPPGSRFGTARRHPYGLCVELRNPARQGARLSFCPFIASLYRYRYLNATWKRTACLGRLPCKVCMR